MTRFVYRPVAVGDVYGGALILPATAASIAGNTVAADAAPEELSTITDMMAAPPMPFLPDEWVGRPVLILTAVYAGDFADGPEALAPFRALAEPIADLLSPMPYEGIYGFTEEAGAPVAYHIRSSFLGEFDASTAEAVMAAFAEAPPGGLFRLPVSAARWPASRVTRPRSPVAARGS